MINNDDTAAVDRIVTASGRVLTAGAVLVSSVCKC